MFNKKIDKERTLIFFDEIQRNTRALTALKYFYEDASYYYVISAGSLLGVHINKKDFSFPVMPEVVQEFIDSNSVIQAIDYQIL